MELTIRINDKEVHDALANFLKTLHIEIVSEKKGLAQSGNEEEEFYNLSAINLSRAYSTNEPEYTLSMVKEPNPDYEKR